MFTTNSISARRWEIGGIDVHNNFIAARCWEQGGTQCPRRQYCRQAMGIGGDSLSTTTVSPPGDGNRGGLDAHNKHYCLRAMGIEGDLMSTMHIIASGRWEYRGGLNGHKDRIAAG